MVLALSLVASPRTGSHSSVADAAPPSVAPVALPLTFEANRGQADASIRYIARAPQYTMGITRVGVLLSARIPTPGASALRRAAIWLKPQGMDAAVRVAPHYRLPSRHTVGFTLGNYSHNAPLVIDPTLVYSTYLGGRDADGGYGIAVDKAGNAYVTGDTQSVDLPLMGGTGARLKSS